MYDSITQSTVVAFLPPTTKKGWQTAKEAGDRAFELKKEEEEEEVADAAL